MARKPAAAPSYDRGAVMGQILDRIAGGESLREICADAGMPDRRQVNRWMHADKDLHARYLEACRVRTYLDAEEVVSIADSAKDAALARVQIDARKWRNAQFNRVQFGEKVTAEHVGAGGGAIQYERIERVIVDPKKPE